MTSELLCAPPHQRRRYRRHSAPPREGRAGVWERWWPEAVVDWSADDTAKHGPVFRWRYEWRCRRCGAWYPAPAQEGNAPA